MKFNPEHIPAVVFDWLQTYDFEELTAEQKQEVLFHFAMEEYGELRHTVSQINLLRQSDESEGRLQRKQDLLARFDALHAPAGKQRSIFSGQVVWKAAAVFLFFLSAALFYQKMTAKSTESTALASAIDTLYVVKEVASAPVRIYDTVFIQAKKHSERATNPIDSRLALRQDTGSETVVDQMAIEELPFVSVRELESKSNQPKRNSMKDDSLLRRYSYVTM